MAAVAGISALRHRGPSRLALVLPVSLLLARAERNQFGSLVIVVDGLVLAVLVVRLQQIWGAPVA